MMRTLRAATLVFTVAATLAAVTFPGFQHRSATHRQPHRLAAARRRSAAPAQTVPTQAAPAPAPVAPAAAYGSGSVQDIIVNAFSPYGPAAVAWGLRVARCESGFNPRAYNPAGPYYGLFQFLVSTFNATPFGGQNILDPAANAGAAAWKYAHGGSGAWGCK